MREEEKKRKNHPLTRQAEEIYQVVSALLDRAPDEEDLSIYAEPMRDSAMIIPVKIAGAMGSGSWLLSMQNAAIIRSHAEYLLTATSGLKYEAKIDQQYVKMLREEMIHFRELFVEWIKELHEMEDEDFTDEWGLFLRARN
jgi:hypothetical protein